ncbi:MAG: VOC family protein [Saprospiraceae bacterium]|nr:VOC family protein [Lewinella sp.]
MKLEHIAIWCRDLEKMKNFYTTVFSGEANTKYTNPNTGFSSYFLTFPDGGARLELMQMPGIVENTNTLQPQAFGIVHLSIQTGSKEEVIRLAEALPAYGCQVLRGPRTTGDGYFEVEALDIEGNRIEVMA